MEVMRRELLGVGVILRGYKKRRGKVKEIWVGREDSICFSNQYAMNFAMPAGPSLLIRGVTIVLKLGQVWLVEVGGRMPINTCPLFNIAQVDICIDSVVQ